MPSLRKKVVKGGIWVFTLRGVQRLFSFVRLIIVARILAPSDFGLMGIALLTMATLETFSQTGFQTALIQKKEKTEAYLDAAWTVTIIRGIILFLILYFIAPYAAIFFKSPKALSIIRIIGISILLQAFTNIGVIYFQKELEFNKQFVYQFTGTIADFVVTVSTAVILRNIWALVFGLLAGNAARCFVSYSIHPYKPHLSSDLGKAKELWGFGKWIFGSSILLFLLNQGDDAFVGKFLGVAMLGFYQLAYRISNMPATEITHVISQVSFPAYSKLQDDISKLREAYLKILQITAFFSIPIAGLIFVLAPDFTRLFLGQKWMAAVPAMQVLAIWGMIRSIGATTGPLFQSIGRPDIGTKLQTVKIVLLVTLIYPLTSRWGILGTSLAVVLNALVANPIADYFVIKAIKCHVTEFVKMLFVPIVAASIMGVIITVLKYIVFQKIGILTFFILLGAGIIVYLGIIQIFDIFTNYGVKAIIHREIFLLKKIGE